MMKARIHRAFNTLVALIAIPCAVWFGGNEVVHVYNNTEMKHEMQQLIDDEGYRACVYKDSLGLPTVGYGHLVKDTEPKEGCVTYLQALDMFKDDYVEARRLVDKQYPWATGEVRLVLTNMMFQLGPSRLAKFKKMLRAMEDENYSLAAAEMLDSKWAKQTENRARRLAFRIYALGV